MFYTIASYVALAVFGIGLIYRMAGWFRFTIGAGLPGLTMGRRLGAAIGGISRAVLGPRLIPLLRVFVMDVVLQLRILKTDRLRWIMHILIFAGFMFLLTTHAFDRFYTVSLFDPFYLSLNPYLLGAGAMVLMGVGIALYRRYIARIPRLSTNGADLYALAILALIMLSGMAMELTKLASFHHYQKLWYVHVYTCLFGLAYLPFSKFFHVFTTPASLLANAAAHPGAKPANTATRQVMELDACTHCTTCSLHCSVAAAVDSIGNTQILPSERMVFLRDYIQHKRLSDRGLAAIAQGVYLCTNCDRCTVVCPSGINLRELWFNVREEMISRGQGVPLMLTPFSYYRGLRIRELEPDQYETPLVSARKALTLDFAARAPEDVAIPLSPANRAFKTEAGLSHVAATFAYCFTCENCTTVCPVAGNYDQPADHLDLLPHQIIRSLNLGLEDLALGSRMLWYCLTCYQCQEHCPQGVKVTDIFYELKNRAVRRAGGPLAPPPLAEGF